MSHSYVVSAKHEWYAEHDKWTSVCMWCAYAMHDQGMIKHIWVKMWKTHN